MHAERTLEVVNALRSELSHLRTVKALQSLAGKIKSGEAEAAARQLDHLRKSLETSPSNAFTPSRWLILKAIGGTDLVGNGLASRLTALLDDYRLRAGEVVPVLSQIQQDLLAFEGFLNNFSSSSSALGIEALEIPQGHCEVGVLFPVPRVVGNLEELGTAATELDKQLRALMEIGDQSGSLALRQVSTSDLQIFLLASASVGAVLATAIGKILEFYKTKLEIEKLRLEIEEKKIDMEAARLLRAREAAVVDGGVRDTAEAAIEIYQGADAGRKNELRILAGRSIRFIMSSMDKGVVFEVTPGPIREAPLVAGTDEDRNSRVREVDHLSIVSRSGAAMQQLAARRLQEALPEPATSSLERE